MFRDPYYHRQDTRFQLPFAPAQELAKVLPLQLVTRHIILGPQKLHQLIFGYLLQLSLNVLCFVLAAHLFRC